MGKVDRLPTTAMLGVDRVKGLGLPRHFSLIRAKELEERGISRFLQEPLKGASQSRAQPESHDRCQDRRLQVPRQRDRAQHEAAHKHQYRLKVDGMGTASLRWRRLREGSR